MKTERTKRIVREIDNALTMFGPLDPAQLVSKLGRRGILVSRHDVDYICREKFTEATGYNTTTFKLND